MFPHYVISHTLNQSTKHDTLAFTNDISLAKPPSIIGKEQSESKLHNTPRASIATKLGSQKIINAVNYTAATETNEQNSGVSLGAQKVLRENENENRTETKTIPRESNEGG